MLTLERGLVKSFVLHVISMYIFLFPGEVGKQGGFNLAGLTVHRLLPALVD